MIIGAENINSYIVTFGRRFHKPDYGQGKCTTSVHVRQAEGEGRRDVSFTELPTAVQYADIFAGKLARWSLS